MKSQTKNKIIVILGPNASGKSALAVKIAQKFKGEIISADSRQVYKGLNIGTGKITKKEMRGVKHHLLDVSGVKKIFTVSDYKKLAEEALKKILSKKKIPIVCGGSGFYIHALLSGIKIPKVAPDWKLRQKLENKTADELFKILKKLDKKRAKTIDFKNKRRIIRAIEISKRLGKVPLLETSLTAEYDILWLGIKRTEKNLKKLIKKRLISRLKSGMINEVKRIHKNGVSWKRLYDLGLEYRYIGLYLQGKISKEEMIKQLYTAIIQFSKRQMTWFKKYSPQTRWVKNSKEAEKLVRKFL